MHIKLEENRIQIRIKNETELVCFETNTYQKMEEDVQNNNALLVAIEFLPLIQHILDPSQQFSFRESIENVKMKFTYHDKGDACITFSEFKFKPHMDTCSYWQNIWENVRLNTIWIYQVKNRHFILKAMIGQNPLGQQEILSPQHKTVTYPWEGQAYKMYDGVAADDNGTYEPFCPFPTDEQLHTDKIIYWKKQPEIGIRITREGNVAGYYADFVFETTDDFIACITQMGNTLNAKCGCWTEIYRGSGYAAPGYNGNKENTPGEYYYMRVNYNKDSVKTGAGIIFRLGDYAHALRQPDGIRTHGIGSEYYIKLRKSAKKIREELTGNVNR